MVHRYMIKKYSTVNEIGGEIISVVEEDILQKVDLNGRVWSLPKDVTNTDYANFKKEINEDKAEIQDADGKKMTASQAKAYIATLP